jgi:hypothetical protein
MPFITNQYKYKLESRTAGSSTNKHTQEGCGRKNDDSLFVKIVRNHLVEILFPPQKISIGFEVILRHARYHQSPDKIITEVKIGWTFLVSRNLVGEKILYEKKLDI